MNNPYLLKSFENSNLLVENLADRIIGDLETAIAEKGFATLALSGGSTPKKLFSKLSQIPFSWEKVRITLVDERWVDTNSQESNEKLVRDTLLQNYASNALFIPLKNSTASAKEGESTTQESLKKYFDTLDIVVLGMGSDGHTASFFPHAKELQRAFDSEDLCCATTATAEPKERITLTRPFLLKAKNLILHIEGEDKKNIFNTAVEKKDPLHMPIYAMMQQNHPILEVYHAN